MSKEEFELLGHDNPLGYPAPVVPVGSLDDCLVAVYASDRATAIPLDEGEHLFVRHSESLREELQSFDYVNERLFALDSESVSRYSIDNEAEYFTQLLQDRTFCKENAFLRLALAKGAGNVSLILLELANCVLQLLETAPNFTNIWYERQVFTLSQQLDPVQQLQIPETWPLLLEMSRDEFPDFAWIQPEIDSEYRYVADQELVEPQTTVDIAIISTLPEQHDVLLAKLPSVQRVVPGAENIPAYFRSELPVASEDQSTRTCSIGVVSLRQMGDAAAVGVVRDVVKMLRPNTVIWVGIAAGISSNGVALGDVLLSNQIIDYDLRRTRTDESFTVHLAPNVFLPAQNISSRDWLELVKTKRPLEGNPRCIAGPMAIGKSPFHSEDLITLMGRWPELVGLVFDSPEAGASQQVAENTGFLRVCGVSDLADIKPDANSAPLWQRYAFDVAASFTIALIQNELTGPITRPIANISAPVSQQLNDRLAIEENAALRPDDINLLMQLANTYLERKRYAEAANALREVLILQPGLIDARIQLGRIYQLQRDWEQAEKVLLEALTYDAQVLQVRTELSKIYQRQYRWRDAEAVLLETLAIDPEQIQARTELSKIYQRQHRWRDAEALLLDSLRIEPEGLQLRTELSKIYQRQDRWRDAEAILVQSLKIDPDQLQARVELSKIYQRQHRWRDAEAVLLQSLKLDPEELNVRTELGKIYQHEKRWDEAEAILLDSLKLNPEQVQVHTELSKIYQHQRRWRDAEQILAAAMNIDPTYLTARLELGKVLQRQRRWQEAEYILAEAVNIDPTHVESRVELSRIFLRQLRLNDAEEMLLQALAIDAGDLHTRRELSRICMLKGKLREAESYLRESLAIVPNDITSLMLLGQIYTKESRYEQAEHLYKQIFEIDQRSTSPRFALASLYLKMKRYKDREDTLFEIYEIAPEDVITLTSLAHVFKRFRKFRVALQLLKNALNMRSTDLYLICELMDLYARLRDMKNFERYLKRGRQILKRDPHNRFKERFRQIRTGRDQKTTLLSLNEVGIFVRAIDQTYVEQRDVRFAVSASATVNNRVQQSDKVFFAKYKLGEDTVADFVEPFFEGISRLRDLR